MKNTIFLLLLLATHFIVAAEPNTLTDAERADGWKLLFDGKSVDGWRSYKTKDFPKAGWVVENGTLHKQASVRGGDIMTIKTYENFEFAWEWKILEKGNNGVKYFITEERKATVGHEYQMTDDATAHDEFSSTASFYLLAKPTADKPMKPFGEWNTSRIVVNGNHVEHWLNGAKVLEYDCGSDAIMTQVPETKFKKYPGFGEKVTGHILLTDHKDPCWFRNVKIRPLK
ncbi:MAG: 3-keto-disaccharide hydrolase [Verrucomicrobiales bacterium]